MTIAASTSDTPGPPADPAGLNVAYFVPGWPPGRVPNGIVSYVGTMIQGLRSQPGARGWAITRTLAPSAALGDDALLLPPPARRSMLGKLCNAFAPPPPPGDPAPRARQIAGLVRQRADAGLLDVLEIEETFGLAGLIAPAVPMPLVVRLHGPWFLNGAALGMPQDDTFHQRDRMERPGLLAAAVVTGVSEQVLRATREHYGLELPGAEVIYNPVPPCADEDQWCSQDCDPDHILFVGRFDRHKGGDTVIDAFARIAATHPTARLSFAGPDRGCLDGAGKQWLLPEYVSAKLPDPRARARFTWLDVQTHEQIVKLRQRAAVTIIASRYETFGIAAVEAMAAGSPLVSTDAGGLAEIVVDGQNALVARPGDADDLAQKVLALLAHRDRAAALGARAVQDAARFHPDAIAAQSVALYRRTVEQFKRRRPTG